MNREIGIPIFLLSKVGYPGLGIIRAGRSSFLTTMLQRELAETKEARDHARYLYLSGSNETRAAQASKDANQQGPPPPSA